MPAKDLRRLGLPQSGAGDRFFDHRVFADPFQRAGHGNGQNRGIVLFGRFEDFADPGVGQAGPGGVVHANKIDVRLHPGQRFFDRIVPLGTPFDHVDPHDGDVGPETAVKILVILVGEITRMNCLTSSRPAVFRPNDSQTALFASGANGFL